MSSSTTLNLAGTRRSRRAGVLAAGALCLLAACRSEPLAAPPPDPGSVLRAVVWHGSVPMGQPTLAGSSHAPKQHVEAEEKPEFHGLRLGE